jgi:hypothetical protein
MTSLSRLALTAICMLALATTAFAQAPSGLVNKLEVQRLVAADTRQANATLASHFNALADRYTADAARHKDMAKAYAANANRSIGTNIAPHCDRLSQIAVESATASREMARYHEQRAGGAAGTVPKNAVKLHAGEGAPAPSAMDLHHLAMMAGAPADHRALAEYFMTLANNLGADADTHAAMAQAYRAGVRKGVGDPAVHCDRLAKLSREAAREASEAATLHGQLANIG